MLFICFIFIERSKEPVLKLQVALFTAIQWKAAKSYTQNGLFHPFIMIDTQATKGCTIAVDRLYINCITRLYWLGYSTYCNTLNVSSTNSVGPHNFCCREFAFYTRDNRCFARKWFSTLIWIVRYRLHDAWNHCFGRALPAHQNVNVDKSYFHCSVFFIFSKGPVNSFLNAFKSWTVMFWAIFIPVGILINPCQDL